MVNKNIEQKILDFLKKQEKPMSQRKISQNIKISYPMILKWCEILRRDNKIEVEDLGGIKLVTLKKVKQ